MCLTPLRTWIPVVVLALAHAAMLVGCTTSREDPAEVQRHFLAGQEEAFATMQRSGIPIVRVVGAVQRPVVLWQSEMTLAKVIVEAGYLNEEAPSRILIQRGSEVVDVDPAQMLQGQMTPVMSGDIIRILP